ncbi:MAG: sigma-70 family RNA polymerase sigma factor [Planctomycetota bacterium]
MDRDRTERLAGRAANDDERAFELLVERVLPRLQVWISLRMGAVLRGRVAPEDALQETLIEAHRSLDRFQDQGPGSFQRWIFSVAENRLRDLHKFHTAQRRAPDREEPHETEIAFARRVTAQTSPSSNAARHESITRLVAGIGALGDDEREIVILRALEERTYDDIAARLARPRASVITTYGRALRTLKRDLAALD